MNSSRNISPMDYPDELGSSRFPPTKRKNSRNGNGSVALGLDLGVERFFSELFNRVSQSPLGLRDDDAGGGLRTPCGGARHSFEDNGNDSKQPLLIKVCMRIKLCGKVQARPLQSPLYLWYENTHMILVELAGRFS